MAYQGVSLHEALSYLPAIITRQRMTFLGCMHPVKLLLENMGKREDNEIGAFGDDTSKLSLSSIISGYDEAFRELENYIYGYAPECKWELTRVSVETTLSMEKTSAELLSYISERFPGLTTLAAESTTKD